MTCTTCGRDNPAHLTFCQECGQRLGPRIAPPTPPIGLGNQEAFALGPAPAPNAAPAASPRAATAMGLMASPAMSPPMSARPVPGERRCKICDTVNGPTLRYCTSCGSTLDPIPGAGAGAAAAPIPSPAPVAVAAAIVAAVAPARVVELGPSPAPGGGAAEASRVCGRCRGMVDGSAQFCKFCGASLAEVGGSMAAGPGGPGGGPAPKVGRPGVNGLGLGASEETVVTGPPNMGAEPNRAAPRGPTSPIAQVGLQALQAIARPGSAPDGGPAALSARPLGSGAGALASPAPSPSPIGPGLGARPASVSPLAPPVAARASVPAAQAQRGRLVVIAKSGADGPSYPFGDLLDVGRSEGNVVVGEDPYLSPRHARILWQNGKLVLRDLASTNGVYLRLAPSRDAGRRRDGDGAEITVPLADGDLILVGQQVLRFDLVKEGEGGFGPAQEHGTLVFGSPAAPRYARLCQRTVEGIARDVYYIRKVETVLGRESGDVVFTEDPFLSRRHAAIRMLSRDGVPPSSPTNVAAGDLRFALVDLGSSNGTFLRMRGDVDLAPGDHFRVGQQLFRVDFDGAGGRAFG
jgi:pSer/pThr/pTyr-binding forkhead associated (FHA) protein